MGRPKKEIPHQLPESILVNLTEHTKCFLLFSVNKDGEIEIHSNPISESAEYMGLVTAIRHWGESVEAISSNQMFHSVVGEENEEEFLPPPDEEN